MLRVWADGAPTGLLARFGRGASFTYGEGTPDNRAISITMPVRTASWNSNYGLNPASLPPNADLTQPAKVA